MADSEDVSTLKRRGRRRLVGAIALVLVAVIVLPMIFDSEPRQAPPPVSVRIPSEDDTGFTPKVTPKAAVVPEVKPEAKAEPRAEPKPEPKPEPKAEPAAEPKPAPKAEPRPVAKKEVKAPAAKPVAPAAGQFMIPVGAYVDPSGVIEQLKQGKVAYYTEPIATAKGTVIRVRAGPYTSQTAAERALAQIQALGLKPGKIIARQ